MEYLKAHVQAFFRKQTVGADQMSRIEILKELKSLLLYLSKISECKKRIAQQDDEQSHRNFCETQREYQFRSKTDFHFEECFHRPRLN